MSAKATKRMWMLVQGQLFRSCRQRYWHPVKQSPPAAGPFMGSESAALTTRNPLMCKIIGTHASSESTGKTKHFIFQVNLEGNPDRSLKPRC